MIEAVALLAPVAAVVIVLEAIRRRTPWSLFLASLVFLAGAACWLVVTPFLLAALANPPSCQDGPCAWDETVDGPTPLRAQQWLMETIWLGGAGGLLVTGIVLAVAAVGAQYRRSA